MGKPSIGVVTVTFNSSPVLDEFLASIATQTFRDFRLFVIDNASMDGTPKAPLLFCDERFEVIPNASNVGVAAANNQGIDRALAAGCTHVLLINNDTVFPPELLSTLLDEMTCLRVDMLIPKILSHDDRGLVWCAGGEFQLSRGYSGVHLGLGEVDNGRWDQARIIQYAPTCCMLIRAEVFKKIGKMDPRYFVYFDDTDFCLRAWRAGVRLGYTPKTVLYHKVGALTGGKESEFYLRYSARNHALYLLKNFHPVVSYSLLGLFVLKILLMALKPEYGWSTVVLRCRALADGIAVHRGSQDRGSSDAFGDCSRHGSI